MWLKKIEVRGFKSFYKKTALTFKKPKRGNCGITAIVGPNGSGKSNVCDALKWGLGAQSKKGFRSKKSRDVIFAGSSRKKPLSGAAVVLYFDNTKRKIDLPYKEVVISRKIYASGENEYFINNSRVRLKSILELLGEAGVGQQSYSIVDQGMADRLIIVSPLERKGIVEEAARVKHFQIKKESSIKKLEKAKINREGALSLIRELKPRLEYLGAQAEKKKEEEVLKRELEEASKKYFGTLWNKLSQKKKINLEKKNQLEKELAATEQELGELRQNLGKPRKERFKEQERVGKLEERLSEARQKENRLLREISIAEGQLEILEEKITFEKSKEERKVDIPYVQRRLQALIEEIKSLRKDKNLITGGLEKIYGLALKLKEELASGVTKRGKSGKTKALQETKEAAEKKKAAMERELEALKREEERLEKKLTALSKEEADRSQDFFQREKDYDAKGQRKDLLRDRLGEIDIELAKLEIKESDLRRNLENVLGTGPEKLNYRGPLVINLGALRQKVEELSRKIGVCETIEEEVVKEYEKVQKRYQFLEKETEDIKKTSTALRKVIADLEEKIESRFGKTLKKINQNFNRFFKIIFKGGSAKLIKVEVPDNEEEGSYLVGLEIKAVPPGKRIKNIGMLSGGEKALTSLAFLFAMIASSAPPFVMLDEVDAALDEANSARFSRILKMMAEKTQFITITHNREVMKEAQILYGITMGKDGVSKLLSLDLERD